MSSATPWLAGRLEDARTGSCSGLSAGSPMWILHHRPGATLWSIAAGPLVNVVLFPILLRNHHAGPICGMGRRPRPTSTGCVRSVSIHRRGPAGFQHPSHLSAGRRPDSSLPALVCAGTRPQLNGGHGPRLDRRRWFHRSRVLAARRLVGRDRRLHADELLGRPATRARSLASRKAAAPRWLRLPNLQHGAAGGRILEVRTVRPGLRHVPNPRSLSPLRAQFAQTKCLDCGRLNPMNDWMVGSLVSSSKL